MYVRSGAICCSNHGLELMQRLLAAGIGFDDGLFAAVAGCVYWLEVCACLFTTLLDLLWHCG